MGNISQRHYGRTEQHYHESIPESGNVNDLIEFIEYVEFVELIVHGREARKLGCQEAKFNLTG